MEGASYDEAVDYDGLIDPDDDDDDGLIDPEDEDDDYRYNDDDYCGYDDDAESEKNETATYLAAQLDADRLPPGAEVSFPWLQSGCTPTSVPPPKSSVSEPVELKPESEIEKKHRLFKQFDMVTNHSDHYYSSQKKTKDDPSLARKIQSDWRLLEKDLPGTIFVRVYEERIDLMRAVIVGAQGTPYHDGLFFFDIHYPSNYPAVPPNVHYHSGGLRLNPNLYNCGKVCLSLLGTWPGKDNTEKWNPKLSNMLQVLLSIQGLVLNEKPYFNEPGYEKSAGQSHGERNSMKYSENTFILSCRTMLFTLKKPPMHFEDLVRGHFALRGSEILGACKSYMEGAPVGFPRPISSKKKDGEKKDEVKKDEVKGAIVIKEKTFKGEVKGAIVIKEGRNVFWFTVELIVKNIFQKKLGKMEHQ